MKSRCCGAKLITVTAGEGTSYWTCQLCNKPADPQLSKPIKNNEEHCNKCSYMTVEGLAVSGCGLCGCHNDPIKNKTGHCDKCSYMTEEGLDVSSCCFCDCHSKPIKNKGIWKDKWQCPHCGKIQKDQRQEIIKDQDKWHKAGWKDCKQEIIRICEEMKEEKLKVTKKDTYDYEADKERIIKNFILSDLIEKIKEMEGK